MLRRFRFYLGISIFWLALSMLFDGMNSLILPVRLFGFVDETRQASALGLVSFAGLLAGILIQPIAGALSDQLRIRIGRKGLLGLGVLLTLVFLAVFGVARSWLAVVAGYILIQSAASIAQAAQQGFIPDLVGNSNRGKASGWKAFMDIGGAMLGFVLLGQLLGEGQPTQAIMALAVALMIAYALTALLVREARLEQSTAAVKAQGLSILDAFRLDLRRHSAFAWLVASRFFFLLGTYAVGRFLLYFVADRLHLNPNAAADEAGGLLAGLALITVLCAPLAGWASDRWGRFAVIYFGAFISATGVIFLIFANTVGQIFLFGALLSLGSSAFASANWALTADLVPRNEAARFFGLANLGTAGAAAAAGLFGPLVDAANKIQAGTGYPVLFIGSALAFLLCALTLRWVHLPRELNTSESIQVAE